MLRACLNVEPCHRMWHGQPPNLNKLMKNCRPDDDYAYLTYWGQVTHICVSKLTIIGSDNGLSPGQHQAIIWTNAGIFFIGPVKQNSKRVPTDKPRKISVSFQWYFKVKIPNFHDNSECYKTEKRRTKCYAWSPHTSYDHNWVSSRKSYKSSYLIWWIIY